MANWHGCYHSKAYSLDQNLWAPPELVGGLRQRCAHNTLQNPIVYGAKLDISKCLTMSTSPKRPWFGKHLGLLLKCVFPSRISKPRNGSAARLRTPSNVHAVCSKAAPCSSCALLAGLMSAWTLSIKHASPSIAASICVDDRTLWSFDLQSLDIALQVTHQFDAVCGFHLNGTKSSFFLKGSQRLLKGFASWNQLANKNWSICKQFKLLGGYYNLTAARRTLLTSQWSKKFKLVLEG